MSEKTLWTYLSGLVPRERYTRIETGETGPGVPDVYYRIFSKKNGWMELKDSRAPNSPIPFKNEVDGLHATQLDWIGDEMRMGGLVWIVARVGRLIYWIHGSKASQFNGCSDLKSLATYVLNGRFLNDRDTKAIRQMLAGELL